jgi:hypothetical protein
LTSAPWLQSGDSPPSSALWTCPSTFSCKKNESCYFMLVVLTVRYHLAENMDLFGSCLVNLFFYSAATTPEWWRGTAHFPVTVWNCISQQITSVRPLSTAALICVASLLFTCSRVWVYLADCPWFRIAPLDYELWQRFLIMQQHLAWITGHFLLTNLLLENMKSACRDSGVEGRIINLTSSGHMMTYPEGICFSKINDPSG